VGPVQVRDEANTGFLNVDASMSIAVGSAHTCARTSTKVLCWGKNNDGQLGLGDIAARNYPEAITGLPTVSSVIAGERHSCALLSTGAVKCWGARTNGYLGEGSVGGAPLTSPVNSFLTSGIVALGIGSVHSCAVDSAGGVQCWGKDGYGQLGANAQMTTGTPVPAVGFAAGVAQIAGGKESTCARRTDGSVSCWGRNLLRQLGHPHGAMVFASGASPIQGLNSAQIALGSFHGCSREVSGEVKCWGYNYNNQIGDDRTESRLYPVAALSELQPVTQIALGNGSACGFDGSTGKVRCWGQNYYGQLGTGDNQSSATPRELATPILGATAVASGVSHSCAVAAGGTYCWGSNQFGELGSSPVNVPANAPVAVNTGALVMTMIGVGANHTCAANASDILCWGSNGLNQLGSWAPGSQSTTPVAVSLTPTGVTNLSAISVGGSHTCILERDTPHRVNCWGFNDYGQAGHGVYGPGGGASIDFVYVDSSPASTLTGVDEVSAGGAHTCARSSGKVWCWGEGTKGQLGSGAVVNQNYALMITTASLGGIPVSVAAGMFHTCAVLDDGLVKCWGANYQGQLGDGTRINRLVPTTVTGITNAVKVFSNSSAQGTCALLATGQIRCWGDNSHGQLGVESGRGLQWSPTLVFSAAAAN
jgi:alpha-tubulin suppressor-like RCC1 family protein